jgi:hypothetical protein
MAVLDPSQVPYTDPRPIYDSNHLPGGPWHRYRPTTQVDAFQIKSAWLQRRADGMLVERDGPVWVLVDPATGLLLANPLMTPTDFAAAYEIVR